MINPHGYLNVTGPEKTISILIGMKSQSLYFEHLKTLCYNMVTYFYTLFTFFQRNPIKIATFIPLICTLYKDENGISIVMKIASPKNQLKFFLKLYQNENSLT